MGFVKHQDCAGFITQPAQFLQKPRCIAHHADIGHQRFGQYASNVATAQSSGERVHIVKLDCNRRRQQILHLPDQAWPVDCTAIAQVDEHIINRAMIAAVEDQNLVAPSNPATPANNGSVCFACCRRHLPLRQSEHVG